MARAVLFNAVDVPSNTSCLMPDNGLATLAACLLEGGHQVEICDVGTVATVRDHIGAAERAEIGRLLAEIRAGRITHELIAEITLLESRIAAGLAAIYRRAFADVDRRIGWDRVDLLGLKLWVGAGADLALSLAAGLSREHPSLRVFAGGPLATLRAEALLEANPAVEAACLGHGEATIGGLAEHCDGRRSLASVPNLLIRRGAELHRTERRAVDLTEVPFPSYDPEVYPAIASGGKLPVLCIDESRGCPMDCHFCAHTSLSGTRWQHRSAEQIVDEMDRGRSAVGARAFRFSGSFTPGKVYREVAAALERRGSPYLYSGFAHVSSLDPEDFPALRRSGLTALFFGVESGAETLLRDGLGKRIGPETAARVLAAALDAGIFVCGSVIHPAPGETEATTAQTRDLLLGIFRGRDKGSALVLPPLPQPGSRWWEEMSRFGFEGDREAVLAALAARRTRHLLPMNTFEPLPYSLDGVPYVEMCRRTAALAGDLRDRGVLTNMGHDAALFAEAAGLSPEAFWRTDHEMFLAADADRIEEVVQQMNCSFLDRADMIGTDGDAGPQEYP